MIALRILGGLVLLVITAICGIGFLATFEYAEQARRTPWQLGYAAIGIASLIGAVLLVAMRRKRVDGSM